MQGLHIDVILFSEAWRVFFIQNYYIYQTDSFPEKKGGTAVAVRKGITHNRANRFGDVIMDGRTVLNGTMPLTCLIWMLSVFRVIVINETTRRVDLPIDSFILPKRSTVELPCYTEAGSYISVNVRYNFTYYWTLSVQLI
jgi:hypothetical protein